MSALPQTHQAHSCPGPSHSHSPTGHPDSGRWPDSLAPCAQALLSLTSLRGFFLSLTLPDTWHCVPHSQTPVYCLSHQTVSLGEAEISPMLFTWVSPTSTWKSAWRRVGNQTNRPWPHNPKWKAVFRYETQQHIFNTPKQHYVLSVDTHTQSKWRWTGSTCTKFVVVRHAWREGGKSAREQQASRAFNNLRDV